MSSLKDTLGTGSFISILTRNSSVGPDQRLDPGMRPSSTFRKALEQTRPWNRQAPPPPPPPPPRAFSESGVLPGGRGLKLHWQVSRSRSGRAEQEGPSG